MPVGRSSVREDLARRIQTLRHEFHVALVRERQALQYRWEHGRALFPREVVDEHRRLKAGLFRYIFRARLLIVLTAPFIYAVALPFLLTDLLVTLYQAVCFPVYGIPQVRRSDYFVFDRGRLRYLNLLERLNCVYCSYGNGLLAYATEIAARTEQYWCPIRHARRIRAPHSRYSRFFEYGNAAQYRRGIESVSRDFSDLRHGAHRSAGARRRNPPPR